MDAIWYILGVFFGILIYSEVQPLVTSFHNAGSLGEVFVWEWLGVSPGVILLIAVLMAVGAFAVGTLVEKKKGTVVQSD